MLKLILILTMALSSADLPDLPDPEPEVIYEEQEINFKETPKDDGMSILSNENDRIYITPEEIQLLNRVVMSEAGNQSCECQEAVATVILNRWMNPEKYPDTIKGVIEQPGQFSTADNGTPTVSVEVAVFNAIFYYNTCCMNYPKQMYYFRSGRYHNFGIPHQKIGDLYFSLAPDAVVD